MKSFNKELNKLFVERLDTLLEKNTDPYSEGHPLLLTSIVKHILTENPELVKLKYKEYEGDWYDYDELLRRLQDDDDSFDKEDFDEEIEIFLDDILLPENIETLLDGLEYDSLFSLEWNSGVPCSFFTTIGTYQDNDSGKIYLWVRSEGYFDNNEICIIASINSNDKNDLHELLKSLFATNGSCFKFDSLMGSLPNEMRVNKNIVTPDLLLIYLYLYQENFDSTGWVELQDWLLDCQVNSEKIKIKPSFISEITKWSNNPELFEVDQNIKIEEQDNLTIEDKIRILTNYMSNCCGFMG